MTSRIFTDTQWLSADHILRQSKLPGQLQDWLLDPGSLTLRLQASGSNFNVRVLQHSACAADSDELRFMQCQPELACQVREVFLCDHQTPQVFARSVIPQATDGLLHELQNIGDKPLGQALFSHPAVKPGAFELAEFAPSSRIGQLNTRLTGHRQSIYGRRRIFWADQAPVLVAEVFLSHAPCYNLINE